MRRSPHGAEDLWPSPKSETFAASNAGCQVSIALHSPGTTGRAFRAAVQREQSSVWSGSEKMMFGLPEKQPAT
jgi:hypothetical protein